MAVQLPEPVFYTLAEVAERWKVSEDRLVRMGLEQQITIGKRLGGFINRLSCSEPISMHLLDFFQLSQISQLTRLLKDHPQMVRTYTETTYDDLVIPTAEIHRIEHQHEAVEKAAADDVLGTKEKEKLQGIIAAMAQILASKAPGYQHGAKPNATRIADAISQTGLVDRKPETIAKEISTAWERFGNGK